MISWLSQTTLMRPEIPDWLVEIGEKLLSNDPLLTTLELTHHRMDDAQCRYLAQKLKENRTVTFLLLSCHNLIDDGPVALAAVLATSQNINKVQLRDLRSSREAQIFFQALHSMKQLEELSIRHSQVDANSAKHLAMLVESHPNLHELRLVDSQIVGSSLSQLCRAVQVGQKLRRLYLINAEMSGEYSGRCIGNMLSHSMSLDELHLCENNLGDDGVAQIVEGLLENGSLKVLNLRSNGIGEQGSLAIYNLLKETKSLSDLFLSANRMGDKGTEVLANGLLQCNLKRLDLTDNCIGPRGAKALAEMLLMNTTLENMNLSFNYLGDVGAIAMADALDCNSTLRCLSLRHIHMGNDGAQAFATKLPHMRGLKELVINRNLIDKVGTSALLNGLRRNMDLQHLHIEDRVSTQVLREIIHCIRLNRAGRRVFRDSSVPLTLWADILSNFNVNVDLDVLYHFISEKPDVFQCYRVSRLLVN